MKKRKLGKGQIDVAASNIIPNPYAHSIGARRAARE